MPRFVVSNDPDMVVDDRRLRHDAALPVRDQQGTAFDTGIAITNTSLRKLASAPSPTTAPTLLTSGKRPRLSRAERQTAFKLVSGYCGMDFQGYHHGKLRLSGCVRLRLYH